MTTGRCEDIGKIMTQQMRGLSGRAPYFSNGSAQDLRELVEIYNRRYDIGFTDKEKADLVNFMKVL
jgi:cytochrome c peroxidase